MSIDQFDPAYDNAQANGQAPEDDFEMPWGAAEAIRSWRDTLRGAKDKPGIFRKAARELIGLAAEQTPEVRQAIIAELDDMGEGAGIEPDARQEIFDDASLAKADKERFTLLNDAEPEQPKGKKKSRIRLVPFEEITLSTGRRYLIKGLIPRVGITVVWGPPKCGKSFWVFDAAMHVALGWKYRGRRIHPGAVVYCAFEGQSGYEARAAAFRQKWLADDERVAFYLMPVTLNLVKDHKELIKAIREKFGDETPVCVVLDTLNRSLEGSESKDEDMGAYIQAADAIREAFTCAVIIVHHCGVDGSRPRGHTSLTGAIEAQLAVYRDGDSRVRVEVELAKDGAQGEVILSELEVVEVGKDEDGEPITSCLVAAADDDTQPTKTRDWPKGLRFVREAITEAMIDQGFDHSITNGPTVRAVAVEDARLVHKRRYAHNGDGDRDEAERKAWRRNFDKAKVEKLFGSDLAEGRRIEFLADPRVAMKCEPYGHMRMRVVPPMLRASENPNFHIPAFAGTSA